jgi:hypothetical protein
VESGEGISIGLGLVEETSIFVVGIGLGEAIWIVEEISIFGVGISTVFAEICREFQ